MTVAAVISLTGVFGLLGASTEVTILTALITAVIGGGSGSALAGWWAWRKFKVERDDRKQAQASEIDIDTLKAIAAGGLGEVIDRLRDENLGMHVEIREMRTQRDADHTTILQQQTDLAVLRTELAVANTRLADLEGRNQTP